MSILFEKLSFNSSELDFSTGSPVEISNFSQPAALDSYMQIPERELKLFKPYPQSTKVTWELKLLIEDAKLTEINALILKQSKVIDKYRRSYNTDSLKGYRFVAKDFGVEEAFGWISSFNIELKFFLIDSSSRYEKKLTKCMLSIVEGE